MSNQTSWNQGRNDAQSGKGPANQQGSSWQDKQAYNAGYNQQNQGNSGARK